MSSSGEVERYKTRERERERERERDRRHDYTLDLTNQLLLNRIQRIILIKKY